MTFIPTFLFPHFLVPPPAARERSINECRDKLVLWDGKSMKSHLKRMGGGSSDAEFEYFKVCLRLVWSLWSVLKSLLVMSSRLILIELYQVARPTRQISFTFGVKMGSIYLIRGGKKLPVGLVLYWADVKAVERVSSTAGLGE